MARELPNDSHGMRILKELEPAPEDKKDDSVSFRGLDQLYGGPSLIEDVKKEQDDKAKRIVDQFNKLKQAVADRDKTISNLRSEMDAKDQELKVKMDSILTLETEASKQNMRLEEAESSLATLNKEKADLISSSAQLNAGHQEIKRTNLKLQDRLNQLKDDNTKQERLISELQANIQNLLLQIDGLAGAEGKLEDATRRGLDLTKKEQELTAFAQSMEAKRKEITEKYEAFTNEAKAMNERRAGYESKIAQLSKANQELEAKYTEALDKQKGLETNMLAVEKKAEELLMLETALKSKEEDLAKAKEKVAQLEAKLQEAEATSDGGGGKKGKKKKKGEAAQFDPVAEEISVLKDQTEDLSRKLTESQQAQNNHKAEAERVCRELEAAKRNLSDKDERIKSLCDEMQKLQGELEADNGRQAQADGETKEVTPLPDEPVELEELPMMEPLEEETKPEPPAKKKKKKL